MKSFPFDSHVTYDSSGTPSYDRAISSDPYRKLIKELFTTGIMPTSSTNMQVVAGENMTVTVKAGFAVVEGCMSLEEDDRSLEITASDTQDRIDTVVLRLNTNDEYRTCDYYVVAGTSASSPVHPDLTRTNSIYEIGLADIFVPANSTVVSDERITDTRYDTERCGVISSISEFDTSTLNAQMNAWSAEKRTEFEAWVASLKDILDEETAGHLQAEIEALQEKINTTKTELETKIDSIELVAEKVSYNDTITALDADNVQDAIMCLANKVVCLRPDTSKLLQEFKYSVSSSFSVSFTVSTDGFFSGGLVANVTNATDHYVRANFWLNGRPISNYAFSNEKAHKFDVYAYAYIPVKAGDVISMDGGVRAYSWSTQGGVYALKAVEFNI